jgi:hypothetical protein
VIARQSLPRVMVEEPLRYAANHSIKHVTWARVKKTLSGVESTLRAIVDFGYSAEDGSSEASCLRRFFRDLSTAWNASSRSTTPFVSCLPANASLNCSSSFEAPPLHFVQLGTVIKFPRTPILAMDDLKLSGTLFRSC